MVSDGTEKPKDEVKTPKVEQETPKETYTKDEVEKLRVDFRTAAEAEVGRATLAAQKSAKQAEDSAKQAGKALAGLTKYKDQARTRELEDAKDQPTTLDVIHARHAKEEIEDELALTKSELGIANQAIEASKTQEQQYTKEQNAREIAGRFQVEVNDLLLTDGSKEAMEKLAHKLTKSEQAPLRVDQGGGGGGGNKSLETLLKVDTSKMPPKELNEYQVLMREASRGQPM